MKKITFLLFIALLPVFGFGQVDLATWALTANGNVVNSQTYVSGGNFTTDQNPISYSNLGALVTGWNNSSIEHYRYFEVSIAPTAGNVLSLSNLIFQQEVASPGPSNYSIKYKILNTGDNPGTFDFFNNSTFLINNESISVNQNKTVSLSGIASSLNSSQRLVLRFYSWGNNWSNGWRIKANTLKITGTSPSAVLTASPDNATVEPNQSKIIDVLANDSKKETVTGIIATNGSFGTTVVNPDKTITYTSNLSTPGTDSFNYTISNGVDPNSTATVNVTIGYSAPTSGPLCGTYYIGNQGHFATITQAVNYLNTNGVSCNVTFLLNNATYTSSTETFPITINDYNGTNDTNDSAYTVTFKPNTGQTVTIENNTNVGSVFKLFNADNIIFDGSNNNTTSKNLTISYTNTVTTSKRTVFWLASDHQDRGAKKNVIKNLIINQYSRNDDLSIGVFSGEEGTIAEKAKGANSNNTVQNVTFNNVGQAVYLFGYNGGNTTRLSTNWVIKNNTIGSTTDASKPFLGIYINNISNYEISSNSIVGLLKNTTGYNPLHSGIIVTGVETSGSILNNVIRDVYNNQNNGYSSGIYVDASNTSIYNNMISNIRQNATDNNDYNYDIKGHGIYVKSGANNKLYHNTVNMNATTTGGRSSCLYIEGGSAIDLRNNIFSNFQTQGTQYAIFCSVAENQLTSNYNDLYVNSNNGKVVRRGSTEYTALTDWDNTGKDANSVSFSPNFISSTDLHLVENTNGSLNNAGTPLASVTIDIDGEARHITTPDIGADEFGCTTIPGDSTVFGDNIWNVYGFNGTSWTPSIADYKGFYTQSTTDINTISAWPVLTSPSSAVASGTNTAWQGCTVNNDNFTVVHKRKGFPQGSYELRMIGWDDDARVYVDGVQVGGSNFQGWSGNADQDILVGVYCLHSNSTIEVIVNEYGGDAKLKMNLVPVNVIVNNAWTGTETDHSIEIQSDIALANDLQVCTCTVKAGQTLTIEPNSTLTVIGNVVVEAGGQIIVENNGSFVQVNDDATFTGANTSFEMKRETQPVYRLDFTYYASPIKETSNFTLYNLSPETLSSKFYSWNETSQGWSIKNAPVTTMEEGRGYIVRAPQTFDLQGQAGAVAKKDTINFVGLPNNGVINFDNIEGSTTVTKWNLIGNPYPSALSIDEFYNNSTNSTNLEGTIYLWTHNTPQNDNGTGIYSYSPSDYASYNRSGGVGTSAGSEGNPGDNVPTGFVAAGQSFFVKGIVDGTSSAVFNNSMRVAGNNNQFFRPGTSEPINNWETTGKHRVWLNITGGTNAFNQALVGYIEGATDGLDWGFDGDQFGGNQVTLYSLLDAKKLTIQGRALPFNDQDEVPLGYKTTLTGTLKIAIDHFDGLFNGQDIYLEDKMLNIVHNLKEADYTFTTVPGTFNDRFVLRYVPAAELGTDNPTVDANSMVIFRSGSQIDIKSNDQTIEHVTVYDLLGKVIFEKGNINAQSFSTSQLNVSNQVVIVKVITDTQAEVVKKVIMN